jgi:hypothetical protein
MATVKRKAKKAASSNTGITKVSYRPGSMTITWGRGDLIEIDTPDAILQVSYGEFIIPYEKEVRDAIKEAIESFDEEDEDDDD